MRKYLVLLIFCLFAVLGFSQDRTVGLLTYQPSETSEGYNLFYPHGQATTFLLDNCGELINSWEGNPDYLPGNSVYLQEDGTLLRCSRFFNRSNDSIWAGGGGAIVQALSWDNDTLWTFEQNDTFLRLHHDIEPMPNGNVLMISWEKKTIQESIDVGRDPNNINLGKLWPDYILEYNPLIDSVVWEWHSWDHLIQDFDGSKPNFGVVADHPERININYENNLGNADWHHSNSIDYNPDLDQIILSVPHFDEFWIIDHSTYSEEAASSEGGNAGKGGDLLFRWGNPKTYNQGSDADQKLFFQHDVQWMNDFVPEDHSLYNKILLFNNRFAEDHSVVNIIDPVMLADGFNYDLSVPQDYFATIKHPDETKLYSTGLSSAQLLPNGNFLILSGRFGYAFELTLENEIVWEYKVPINSGQFAQQGDEIGINNNLTFRLKRYPFNYPAFEGRDLSSKGVLQIESDTDGLCAQIVPIVDEESRSPHLLIIPNPVVDVLQIRGNISEGQQMVIFDHLGRKVMTSYQTMIDVNDLESGIYFLKVEKSASLKFIKL